MECPSNVTAELLKLHRTLPNKTDTELPLLAARGFALARYLAILSVHIIHGTDDPNGNDEEPQDAE